MSRHENKNAPVSRETIIYNHFVNLAIKRFKWSNLPDGLTSDILENMLITHGQLGAFMDRGLLKILPAHSSNKVNVYNEPISYMLYGFNGETKNISAKEMVRLRNNPLGTGDKENLLILASRLDNIEQTQEVNLFQQCIPKIITTNRDGVLTAKNIIKRIKDFSFVILTRDKGINTQIKADDVIDTSSPYLLDKLADYDNYYTNKTLTYLGINNSNTDKKERLITDEVNANNDHIFSILDMYFECRKEFCDNVNKQFGINIAVEKREVDEVYHDNTTDSEE